MERSLVRSPRGGVSASVAPQVATSSLGPSHADQPAAAQLQYCQPALVVAVPPVEGRAPLPQLRSRDVHVLPFALSESLAAVGWDETKGRARELEAAVDATTTKRNSTEAKNGRTQSHWRTRSCPLRHWPHRRRERQWQPRRVRVERSSGRSQPLHRTSKTWTQQQASDWWRTQCSVGRGR